LAQKIRAAVCNARGKSIVMLLQEIEVVVQPNSSQLTGPYKAAL
jgi:hypothetical protein